MKVLTCARHFPKGHPKEGKPTYFVEKIWNGFRDPSCALPDNFIPWTDNYSLLLSGEQYLNAMTVREIKHHTIRAGSRFKPGDMVSLRVWADKPYRSKQIEFAQVEVKKVWGFNIHVVGDDLMWQVPGSGSGSFDTKSESLKIIATNDGLEIRDFIDWFIIHPKAKGQAFTGQIITWSNEINYQ